MPSMMVACMNHPGPIADPTDPTKQIIDPYYNRSYTTFCYTLQYLPGKTTYLDTPVLPVSAFAAGDHESAGLRMRGRHAGVSTASTTAATTDRGCPTTGSDADHRFRGAGGDVVNPAFDPAVYYNDGTCPTNPADPMCTTNPNDPRLQKNDHSATTASVAHPARSPCGSHNAHDQLLDRRPASSRRCRRIEAPAS